MNVSGHLLNIFNIACRSETTVLITGETGTGKTSLARSIHNQSSRRSRPFLSVNLASIHEGVLESELFGHEKGSFTGADIKRIGRLELGNGGTVFLDEVGELSLRLQARLLEFLQSRTITPVGGNREIQLDVRIIAATHRNLSEAVNRGLFREDLFHRLRIVSIPLSPLRDRAEDFQSLLQTSLKEIAAREKKNPPRVSSSVSERLERYHWPGNIRELRNVLEYAVLSCNESEIKIQDLPLWMIQNQNEQKEMNQKIEPVLGVAEVQLTLDYHGTFERFEKEYLRRALSRNGGRISRTAQQIGMNKTTLLRRVRAYRLYPDGPVG